MREPAVSAWATVSSIDLDRWIWSPGFQGAARPVAVMLVVGVAILALGCLVWRAGSGPATHVERAAVRSNWRFIHTGLALLFPLLLATGAWMIVLPGPEPLRLVLVSRALHPELFDKARWTAAAVRAAAAPPASGRGSAAPIDVGPIVDDALRELGGWPELPTRDDLEHDAPAADKLRILLVNTVLKRRRLGDLRLSAEQDVVGLESSTRPHAIPAWLVESVELGCLRLLVERTNVRGVLIGTAGRTDRFGQQTYVDASGYLAGRGTLGTEAVRTEVVSKSESAITLVNASPWPGDKALLLFRVPPTTTSANIVKLYAVKGGSSIGLADQSFTPGPRVQVVPRLIPTPVDAATLRAVATGGTTTEAALPGPPAPVSVLVPANMVADAPTDADDRSYFRRAMDDLRDRGQVTFATTATAGRIVRLETDPSNAGIWLHFAGATFDRTLKARGTNAKLREFDLREVATPSLLSLDRHQFANGVEPAVPAAGGFVLGWMPAYQTLPPPPPSGIVPVAPLQLGEVKEQPASIPLVVVLPDGADASTSVIWFGMPPLSVDDTSIGAAAYWWTVGRLAQRCGYPANLSAAEWKATAPSAELRPIALLGERDIARVSSMAHAAGSMWLGVALVLASSATIMNVVRAGRKRGSRGY
jgi:hypothetical protein